MDEQKISIIGLVASGKTMALQNLCAAVNDKRHGFLPAQISGIKASGRETKALIRTGWNGRPDSTDTLTKWKFELTTKDEGGNKTPTTISLLDVPGEDFQNVAEDPHDKERAQDYSQWLNESVGAVVLISSVSTLKQEGFSDLLNTLDTIIDIVTNNPESKFERLVVAISMFELFLLPFGDMALDMATHPETVRVILRQHLKSVEEQLREFRDFDDGNRHLQFAVFSTFGFVPSIGCPNVSADSTDLIIEEKPVAGPIKDKRYFPFLVADPFIFAATGLKSDFLFSWEQIFND